MTKQGGEGRSREQSQRSELSCLESVKGLREKEEL